MTEEERVASLHMRMAARRRQREARKTAALGTGCGVLTLCLLLIFGEGTAHSGGTAGVYSGAMMLFEGAGAYVLTALLAFVVGAGVTLYCIHQRKNKSNGGFQNKRAEEEQ